MKNILVKDFQNFVDRILTMEEKFDPIAGNSLPILKGHLWRHLRTHLTPVFTSHKIKLMFYLVDICGKELADCVGKATSGGKLPPRSSANTKRTENLSVKPFITAEDIYYIQIKDNLHYQHIAARRFVVACY
jgi:hypothetical protein